MARAGLGRDGNAVLTRGRDRTLDDVVYVAGRQDNEDRSPQVARDAIERFLQPAASTLPVSNN